MSTTIHSQETGDTTDIESEKSELERMKEIEQLKLDLIELQKKQLLARLPDTETTGAEGNVSVDDKAGYYAEIMSYQTLGQAATAIVHEVKHNLSGGSAEIILIDQASIVREEQLWRIIEARIRQFRDQFEALQDAHGYIEAVEDLDVVSSREAVFALATAATLLGGLADLAAFFKVDREFKGRAFTLDASALQAETARRLVENDIGVLIPHLSPVGTDRSLVSLIEEAQADRNAAAALMRRIKRLRDTVKKSLARKEADFGQDKNSQPEDQNGLDRIEAEIELLKARSDRATEAIDELGTTIDAFDAYTKAISEPNGQTPAPLEQVAVIDLLKANPEALRLHLSIVSQGGEVQLTESPWHSGRISYLGGSVTTYFLFDASGVLVAAGSLPIWRGRSYKPGRGIETLEVSPD